MKAATSLSHGVSATPIAKRSGYVTATWKNLKTVKAPCWSFGETARVSFRTTAMVSIVTGAGKPVRRWPRAPIRYRVTAVIPAAAMVATSTWTTPSSRLVSSSSCSPGCSRPSPVRCGYRLPT